MNRRTKAVIGTALTASLLTGGTALADARGWWPGPKEVRVLLPDGQSNPAIANGVATGGEVALYQSSGLGPSALNPTAPPGTPEYYTDPSLTEGATGFTITEAQALVVLRNIKTNLVVAPEHGHGHAWSIDRKRAGVITSGDLHMGAGPGS
ncbi:hypothetical protein [Streptomyces sp. HC307]|uniref:hypothetical protein n=1 Tax=Streptomyces flavusporus TaxID=3385496 RepID=UPI0039173C57